MNETPISNRTPVLELVILFSAFSILLSLLLIGNPQPIPRITVQNINQVHQVFQVHTQSDGNFVSNLTLSKNNNILIAASSGMSYVWNLSERTLQTSNLSNAGGFIEHTAFISNQPIMTFVIGLSPTISILNSVSVQPIVQLRPKELIGWQFSQDGHWFAVANDKTSAMIIDVNTNKVHAKIASPEGYFFSERLVFSPDNQLLATFVYSNTCSCKRIVVWDVSTGQNIQEFELDGKITPYALDFSQDHSLLFISGEKSFNYLSDGTEYEGGVSDVEAWNLDRREKIAEWSGGALAVQHLFISPNNQRIAAVGYGDVWLWDTHDMNEPKELIHLKNSEGNSVAFDNLAVNKDWTLLAISNPNSDVLIYDIQTAKLIGTLSGHISPYTIGQILFSDNGYYLVTNSSDQTIRFWSIGEAETKPFTQINSIALPTVTLSPTPSLLEVMKSATAFAPTLMALTTTPGKN